MHEHAESYVHPGAGNEVGNDRDVFCHVLSGCLCKPQGMSHPGEIRSHQDDIGYLDCGIGTAIHCGADICCRGGNIIDPVADEGDDLARFLVLPCIGSLGFRKEASPNLVESELASDALCSLLAVSREDAELSGRL